MIFSGACSLDTVSSRVENRCSVSEIYGAFLTTEQEGALWKDVFMVPCEQRREFERELQAPNRKLAVRYRLSVKTVAKSRLWSTTKDPRMGPATLRSAKLIRSNDEIVVETDNAAAEASSREPYHS